MRRHHEFLTMAADSRQDMERVAHEMHEDRDPRWHSIVTESSDPIAIAGAQAQGRLAFTVERWWTEDTAHDHCPCFSVTGSCCDEGAPA